VLITIGNALVQLAASCAIEVLPMYVALNCTHGLKDNLPQLMRVISDRYILKYAPSTKDLTWQSYIFTVYFISCGVGASKHVVRGSPDMIDLTLWVLGAGELLLLPLLSKVMHQKTLLIVGVAMTAS